MAAGKEHCRRTWSRQYGSNPLLQGTSSLEAKENLGTWVAEVALEDKWDIYDRVNSII